MRGSPILRLVLMAIALALAGIPVWVLTRATPDEPAQPPAAAESPSRWVDVEMTASAPGTLSLSALGQVLLASPEGATSAQGRAWISREADLVASAVWPAGDAPHALRVVIREDGKVTRDATFWGAGSVEDVVP